MAEAARAFHKAERFQKASDCLLKHLLSTFPLGSRVADANRETLATLRSGVKQLDAAISAGKLKEHYLSQTFQRIVNPNLLYGALLRTEVDMPTLDEFFFLDLALQRQVTLASLTPEAMRTRSQSILRYARFLQAICRNLILPDGLFELMGLERVETEQNWNRQWLVPLTSPLFLKLPSAAKATERGAVVEQGILPHLVSDLFSARLFEVLQNYGDQALALGALEPLCFYFAVEGMCDRQRSGECLRQHTTATKKEHFESRMKCLNMLLPLCKPLSWLAALPRQRDYERNELHRLRCGVLDAYV